MFSSRGRINLSNFTHYPHLSLSKEVRCPVLHFFRSVYTVENVLRKVRKPNIVYTITDEVAPEVGTALPLFQPFALNIQY